MINQDKATFLNKTKHSLLWKIEVLRVASKIQDQEVERRGTNIYLINAI